MKHLLLLSLVLSCIVSDAQFNLVTHAGNRGKEAFYDVTQIDDGTFLVCGYAENLSNGRYIIKVMNQNLTLTKSFVIAR